MALYLVLILMHKPDLHWNFVVSNHHCSFILFLQENKCHICTDVEPQRSGAGSETLLFLFFHRLLMLQLILDVFVGSSCVEAEKKCDKLLCHIVPSCQPDDLGRMRKIGKR